MTETEIERLVVRIVAETKEYSASVQEAVEQTRGAAEDIQQATQGIGASTVAMGNLISNGLMAVGQKFLSLKNEASSAWAEDEKRALQMSAVLKINGRDVDALTEKYTKFAESMEDIAAVNSDTVTDLLKTAETMGVTGDSAMRAAQNAISMQSSFGMSAHAAIRMTTQLEQGHVMMLGRYIPALKGVKDEAKKVAIAQEFMSKAFAGAKVVGSSYSGSIENVKNHMGHLMSDIGSIMAKVLQPFNEWTIDAIRWLRGLSPEVQAAAVKFGMLTAGLVLMKPFMSYLGGPAIKMVVTAVQSIVPSILGLGRAVIGLPMTMIRGVMATLSSLSAILMTWPVVIGGAVAAVIYFSGAWEGLWNWCRGWADWIGDELQPIIETIKSGFSGVVDSMNAGQWGLAARIAWTTVKVAFMQGAVALDEVTGGWVTKTFTFFRDMGLKIAKVWHTVVAGIKIQVEKAVNFLSKKISDIVAKHEWARNLIMGKDESKRLKEGVEMTGRLSANLAPQMQKRAAEVEAEIQSKLAASGGKETEEIEGLRKSLAYYQKMAGQFATDAQKYSGADAVKNYMEDIKPTLDSAADAATQGAIDKIGEDLAGKIQGIDASLASGPVDLKNDLAEMNAELEKMKSDAHTASVKRAEERGKQEGAKWGKSNIAAVKKEIKDAKVEGIKFGGADHLAGLLAQASNTPSALARSRLGRGSPLSAFSVSTASPQEKQVQWLQKIHGTLEGKLKPGPTLKPAAL